MGQSPDSRPLGPQASEALRRYASLLVEHERVRRLAGGRRTVARREGPSRCRVSAPVRPELRALACFSDLGRASQPLVAFCARLPEGEGAPDWVPTRGYLAALASALELAGDAVLRARLDPPWGAGDPRAPRTTEAFEALARRLRDLDGLVDRPGSLASALDRLELPRARAGSEAAGVALDAATFVVSFGDTSVAVPEGPERDLLRALLSARRKGQVVPLDDRGRYWKTAVDCLRRRIQRATGRALLPCLVLSARRPVGGYCLNPSVRVTGAAEAGLVYMPTDGLERRASGPLRRRGRRPRDDEDD